MNSDAATQDGLKRGLTARHIRFIALGSAIGTGLFYGSAEAIKRAGPSVLLAYLIGRYRGLPGVASARRDGGP